MKTENKKIIITKHDLYWHFIELYLEGFCVLNIYADKEFYKLFRQLKEYVNGKIKYCGKGDIVEEYIIAEQLPIDEQEYQDWLNNKND